jgi:hypothetical protein
LLTDGRKNLLPIFAIAFKYHNAKFTRSFLEIKLSISRGIDVL